MAKKQQTETPQASLPMTAAEQSRAELAARDAGAVVVEIYDQVYQLSGTDPMYIQRLAALVDARMRAISAHGATVDSLRVAVLAALNIADEMLSTQARHDRLAATMNHATSSVHANVQSRTGSLMDMLDEVLDSRKAG
ncbi:cell division protein ZapA [Granulicella sp. 5B5]|uniref:cell division protein ZapA n=1 Tax=Granulicella sp. 5B5 TaxID=1617967 RepID=UPI0031FE12BB